jgi:hypothetical protein
MDDWLSRSLNITASDIEAEWQARFQQELQAVTQQ